MSWSTLKEFDFVTILDIFTLNVKKAKIINEALYETSKTSIPQVKSFQDNLKANIDLHTSIIEIISLEMEMIYALKEALLEIEISLDNIETRL